MELGTCHTHTTEKKVGRFLKNFEPFRLLTSRPEGPGAHIGYLAKIAAREQVAKTRVQQETVTSG